MNNIKIQTPAEGFLDISIEIKKIVRESGVVKGLCNVYIPHTTAGITINENADPDVVTDMLEGLDKIVPKLKYRHYEGNTIAHIKASLMGASINIPIDNGVLCLGQWQGIYFCEFDGPRTRSVYVNIIS
ncbi:MAG: secondary thiamine-phosphate synthase enzyme YjbQ [Negativicutes bacterium]|jgi:secondary thiamine-phosphate synthase enzyme|nr:secondary thiamine-phosphate synthase enzyme YjbQ [Negativicutes bacterium]